ncbi:50S ribosomal protein L6 [Engelhardtia mirabilis]|uniref:Large ribosomal subunit protein uL6 n=1 Tax=Engelhardtia mirabilis TaxID=2528011 RepID=A0A518BPC1_9BACT|nr:50S ribosomal protein L6 [Planctomycetes bacterium Pla133]QDV03152.1 50S ribosomal protein L6 [Planctomycetes bacterium Pla86]
MSRIGKAPVPIPSGVTVEFPDPRQVRVKGPKGTLEIQVRPEIDVALEDNNVQVSTNGSGPDRESGAYHGLTRALINNMVVGVSTGFEKGLEIVGVGWNAQAQGRKVVLNIGFCHQVEIALPDGIDAETPVPTQIVLRGVDKQAVGQVAARIRAVRPPEPYKGKGIRYVGEHVRRKSGKSFGS